MRILLLLLLLPILSSAQKNLSESFKTSAYTYVYKINTKEAYSLFRSRLIKISEHFLHTKVDSFPTGKEIPVLKRGNYLIVWAAENKLNYELKTIDDTQVKLINNQTDFALVIHDKTGNFLSGPKVFLNRKAVPYNRATQSYRLDKRKRGGLIRIYNADVLHCLRLQHNKSYNQLSAWRNIYRSFPLKYVVSPLRKLFHPSDSYHNYFREKTKSEKKHNGFMAFSKPIYKPGDTVRMKAFVTTRRGRPVHKELLVRLTDKYIDIDTIIARTKPYRKGGYTHEFVLSDSLDLDLDEEYMLTLETLKSRKYNVNEYDGNLDEEEYALKRKVLLRGFFHFEEYELKSVKFNVRSDKEEHNRGDEVSVYLKATDENGLAVMDGRTEVLVRPSAYGHTSFDASKVFLPDTLWYHTQVLDPLGETRIVLPDSIFPAASFNYEVVCTFLNSNNETETRSLHQTFENKAQKILFRPRSDSLEISIMEKGKQATAEATIYALGTLKDSLQIMHLKLPVTIRIVPFVQSYTVIAGGLKEVYEPKAETSRISSLAYRTRDSISVQLSNPYQVPVWYTLFAGRKVIYKGYGATMSYISKTRTPKNYSLSLQYIYGNKVHSQNFTIPYRDKLLGIEVKQPEFVYPGQTASIEITTTDASGKPVPDTDITAYAFTRKFERAQLPFVPYYGKSYPYRKAFNYFNAAEDEELSTTERLNWQRWSREMRLDSIEYFKFLHPASLYINHEAASDSITQIAPFVVKNGDLQSIHHIYIDEKPVFFSQAQHLQRYSFKVSEGKHALRIRTADHMIHLDSFWATKGEKTFISINADTANKRIRIEKMPDTLTNFEKVLWSKYMILIENYFGEKMAYVNQDSTLFALTLNKKGTAFHSFPVLIGPITSQYADLVVKNNFTQTFEAEGSYLYHISKGLIKQKQLKHPYPFASYLINTSPQYNFKDYVLTEKEIDSLWQDYLDHRSATQELFTNPELNKLNNGLLQIGVPKDGAGKPMFIKNIILFRYSEPHFARIYKGTTTNFGFLQPEKYRLFFLLRNDEYFIKENIVILPNGINYYETGIIVAKPKDSLSSNIAATIHNRDRSRAYYNSGDLDKIKEAFNASYLDKATFTRRIYGQVKDNRGDGLAGVAISIKGTQIRVSTDAQGFFYISIPEKAHIIISSVGFETVEIKTGDQDFMDITMYPLKNALNEVVVMGYSTQRKSNFTASVATVSTNALQGKAAGVLIRGTSSAASGPPMIIVDGLPFAGRMEDLDASLIASITVLKESDAVAIYGSRGVNGVIVITKKKSAVSSEAIESVAGNTLRRNFRDNAYWQPRLRTDANGRASFRVTFPDDITNWRTFVIAMDDQKRTGFTEGSIKSFKALSAAINLPQFAIGGDSMNVIGKTQNYLTDSIRVRRSFSINGRVNKETYISLRNAFIDSFIVEADKSDSLKLTYTIRKEDGYFDGEERTIPVFQPGVLETKGFFAALDGDTSFTLQLDSLTGNVKLYAESSVLPVLLDEIESIRNYEYLCNEQLASKLKALLLKKKIHQYLKKEFRDEKAINELISRLNKSRSGAGLWGWWSNNEPLLWVSLHVLEAMLQAEQDGYKMNLNKQMMIDYLVQAMESNKTTDKITSMHLLHALNAKADYKSI